MTMTRLPQPDAASMAEDVRLMAAQSLADYRAAEVLMQTCADLGTPLACFADAKIAFQAAHQAWARVMAQRVAR